MDEAHCWFNHAKVEGLIRRARLRYQGAEPRRLDLVDERSLDRNMIAQLGTCSFIERQQNVVFQRFTGSGNPTSVRPGQADLSEPDPGPLRPHARRRRSLGAGEGETRFLNKYSAFTLLVIDEWLLDHPYEGTRSMLLERRYEISMQCPRPPASSKGKRPNQLEPSRLSQLTGLPPNIAGLSSGNSRRHSTPK